MISFITLLTIRQENQIVFSTGIAKWNFKRFVFLLEINNFFKLPPTEHIASPPPLLGPKVKDKQMLTSGG